MKSMLLAAAFLLPASMASAQPAAKPAPKGAVVYDASCSLFHRSADGSWNATRAMTLQPKSGPIPLRPNIHFKPGVLFGGFDLAAALEASCPH